MAGGDGASAYLVAAEPPPPPADEPVYGRAPAPWALMHGIGNARSEPFEPGMTLVGIRWYAADPDGQSCRITITLEPLGVEMLATEIDGWDGGDHSWPRDFGGTPLVGDHWIEVDTDCSWSLRVVPIQS